MSKTDKTTRSAEDVGEGSGRYERKTYKAHTLKAIKKEK